MTLGVGIAAYIVAVMFSRYENFQNAGMAFFLISGLVMPLGLFITANKMSFDISSPAVQAVVYLICFVLFLGSFFIFRRIIFTLFAIIFGTCLFSAIIYWIVGNNFSYQNSATFLNTKAW